MTNKIFLTFFMAFALLGCASPMKYTVAKNFTELSPRTVAVLPVVWDDFFEKEDRTIAGLFRTMSEVKLRELNYKTVPTETVDARYAKLGAPSLKKMTPSEMAAAFDADAVLVIKLTEWDRRMISTYASLKVRGEFSLHSYNGTELWAAEYRTGEADMSLDKPPMELAVIKAYEPKVQRFIEAIFSTLPGLQPKTERPQLYQWLP